VQIGDVVLKRSIYRGNVRWAFPHRYVGDWNGRIGIYCCPGSDGKSLTRGPDGYLTRWIADVAPAASVWDRSHVLRFESETEAHDIEICWDRDWQLEGWYVNLQAPVRSGLGRIDTTDHVLDIWVDADGTWRWKDEDELEEAISLGVFDAAGAAEVRAEGERAIAAKPWPTGWEDWRPPEEWGPLGLPRDWHVV
jgi:Protein of unknown function (DUF402)